MKNIIMSSRGIVLLFLISLAHAQQADMCYGVTDGVFLPNLSSCTSYYVCMGQVAYALTCPTGYNFDSTAQECNYPSDTKCVTCPTTAGISYLALGGTCAQYVLCVSGQGSLRSCLDGLQFNAVTSQCDFAATVGCTEDATASCSASTSNTVTYVPSPSNCNAYTICLNGTAYPQTCATGLNFNPAKNGCETPANYNCTTATARSAVFSSRSGGVSSGTIDLVIRPGVACPRSGTHFLPHARNCARYIVCVDGQSALMSCTEGLHYDSKSQNCRLPKYADCRSA